MPTNPNKPSPPPDHILSQELAETLGKVTQLVHSEAKQHTGDSVSLALARVLNGVSPTNWEAFASMHGLEDWLCIPLSQDLAQSVEQVLAMQSRLAFQRDHDALTGVGNRGYFNRRFEAEVERALRSRNELSLLYLDLDDFKKINDTFGHSCGDMVLQRLAQVLRSSVRHYDIVTRVGGEEFAIILPATSCWTGVMLGNRVLETFSGEQFSCNDTVFSMTFSGGVSSLALLDEDKRNCSELLKSADMALYDAKRGGKNAIAVARSDRLAKDQDSLVHAQEKQLLFGPLSSE